MGHVEIRNIGKVEDRNMWEIEKCGSHEEVTKTGGFEMSGDVIFKEIE